MSLHAIAKHMASHGRDEDKVLVHMTPREVEGLQAIAMAHGGSLSINPKTGLPEAGFLKSILPMLAGLAVSWIPGVNVAVWSTLAGAATGALTGDKKQSLLMRAGLGALGGWGGGGLGQALTGAGAAASTAGQAGIQTAAANTVGDQAAQQAAKIAAEKGMTEAAKQQLQQELQKKLMAEAVQTQTKKAIADRVAQMGVKGATTYAGNASSALGGLGSVASKQGLTNAGNILAQTGKAHAFAAAAPTMSAMSQAKPIKGTQEVAPEYHVTTYNPGKVNPNWGKPGNTEPYFIGQGYGPTTVTKNDPYKPTYSSYDKKGNPVGPAGPTPLEQAQLLAQQNQQGENQIAPQQPIDPNMAAMQQYMQQNGMTMPNIPKPYFTAADGGDVPNDSSSPSAAPPMQSPLVDYINKVNGMSRSSIGAAAQPQTAAPAAAAPAAAPAAGQLDPAVLRNLGSFMGTNFGQFGGLANFAPSYTYDAASKRYTNQGVRRGYAKGGYTDSEYKGGRLLSGPGTGVSDSIPAVINHDSGAQQPAKLSNGEFVIPAAAVLKLGDGDKNTGSEKLYAMLDRLDKVNLKNGKTLKAERYLPA